MPLEVWGIYIYFAGVTMGLFDNCLENSDKHASYGMFVHG